MLLRNLTRRVDRLLSRGDESKRATVRPLPVFHEWAARYLPHYFTCAPSSFHQWLAGKLNSLHANRGQRINLLAPRGAAKSTWISQSYPLYCGLEHLEPFIIITSDTGGQAEKYLDAIKAELTDNEQIARDYPHVFGKGPVWRADAIELRNGVRIETLGTGSKVRGRKHRQFRPRLIIVDDPQNVSHIISPLQRSRSMMWLKNDVANAGEPETNIIVAGTALHADGIVCSLQSTPGWHSALFRSIMTWPERMDLWEKCYAILRDYDDPNRDERAEQFYRDNRAEMDAGASVLWPEREPLYALMVKRASIGETAFLFEHQNEPTDPSACEWPPACFQHGAFWFDDWPEKLVVRTLFLDPSKGAHDKQGDYSAYVRYGRDGSGVEYVDADLQRRGVDQIVADGIEHVRQWNPDGFGVEGNAFQDLLAPLFRARAAELRVEMPSLHLFTNTVNKLVRIRRLTEPLTQRKMRFRRTRGTQLLVEQLRQFPNAANDDGPDALEGARRLAIMLNNKRNAR